MLRRSFGSRDRVNKVSKPVKKSFRDAAKTRIQQQMESPPSMTGSIMSSIITIAVGPTRRLFACHEDILCISPFFASALGSPRPGSKSQQVELPEEQPEVFSAVLEYLYKGDYYPRLLHDKARNTFMLEDASVKTDRGCVTSTVFSDRMEGLILRDTGVYCAADMFGLVDLKRIALRKQGLQTGIQIDVILRSARFAYAYTSEDDAKLRAHFLALIIRSRKAFKRSGTMQMEMELGGSKMFFDLFVAMANHIDDIVELANVSSPRTI